MAMSMGGGGGRRGSRRGFKPMADINVTPMVDVMLVLLIIFMVTAPLLTAGVEVDVPKTKAAPLKGDDKPLTVSALNVAGFSKIGLVTEPPQGPVDKKGGKTR